MSFYEQESTEFENQYVVVTGGSSGIGLHIVKYLLYRGIKKLAILDKIVAQDSCRRLTAEFGKEKIILIKCDISIASEIESCFKNVLEMFPRLDILINNAGILDDSAWEKEIATNLNGTIRSTLIAMQHMSKLEGGNGGTIINTSSLSGFNPSAGSPIYSAISSAIVTFTSAFAKPFHYNKTGVRMMTVCPGLTYTRIISGASKKMLSDEIGKEWLKEISTTTTQKPECVASGIIHMLLHGKNGTTWVCEGGKNIYEINSHPGSSPISTENKTL